MKNGDLIMRVREMLNDAKITVPAIAQHAGITPEVLWNFLSGDDLGPTSLVNEKVNKAIFSIEHEKDGSVSNKGPDNRSASKFIKTKVAKEIFETANACKTFKEIALATGDSGIGKTFALKEYCRKDRIDRILIEADPGCTEKVLFPELYRMVCGYNSQDSVMNLFEGLLERFQAMSAMIIIDECENVSIEAIDLLRRFHDKADVPILLVGTPILRENLSGATKQHPQLWSRIGLSVHLPNITPSDCREMLSSFVPESESLWPDFEKHSMGNARRLRKLIERTRALAEINGGAIDCEIINTVVRQLNV